MRFGEKNQQNNKSATRSRDKVRESNCNMDYIFHVDKVD